MALPEPRGKQAEVLALPAEGHTVVLGTAGSGKTTLAILRAAYLADPDTDHSGRTLLLTFNTTLVAYLKHLQDGSLGNVVVENYHKFARGYLHARGKCGYNKICDNNLRETCIKRAIEKVTKEYQPHEFFERSIDFFSEEVRWIAKNGIGTYDDYKEADRVGRGMTRVPQAYRKAMYRIWEEYLAARAKEEKLYDWDDIAGAAKKEFEHDTDARRYKHVVIDEGQDFSPEMLRSLTKAIPDDGSFTLFGDVAQQIYGHRISWKDAGLNVKKVWEFKQNYRNTKEIARLGLAITKMPYFKGPPDMVEPEDPKDSGPQPTLAKCKSFAHEATFTAKQAIEAAKTLKVGIFARTWNDIGRVARYLPTKAIKLLDTIDTWRKGAGIWYGTLHSGKGLEFDLVLLPFCNKEWLPDPIAAKTLGGEDAAIQDGRLLYVGVTRARTRLIMTYSTPPTELLPDDATIITRVDA